MSNNNTIIWNGISDASSLPGSGGGGISFYTGSVSGQDNATLKMHIKTDGKVGIGTNNPSSKLHVEGDVKIHSDGQTTGGACLQIDNTNTSNAYPKAIEAFMDSMGVGQTHQILIGKDGSTNDTGSLAFYYAGNASASNRLQLGLWGSGTTLNILGSGNVGIGTLAPGYKLQVDGSVDILNVKGSTGNAFVRFTDSDATADFSIGADDGSGAGAGAFILYDRSSSAYRLIVNSGGHVGIGETDISGFGGTYKGLDIAYKGTGLAGRTDNPTLDMRSNLFYDGSNYKYGEGSTTAGILSVGGGQLIFSNAPSGTAGATATVTERMRINDSGNVGIGTNGPTTGLDIYGAGNIPRIKLRESSGNQLNIGLWDGSNYRIEGDSSRPLLITSYHSNGVAIGGSGATNMQVSTGGVDFLPNSGGSFNFKGKGGNQLSILTAAYTAGAGTSIGTSNVQVVNSAFGALVFVAGYGNGQFCDLVYFGYNASPTIIAQQTIVGSPPSRIYTGSGYALYLRYSSGSLTTKVNCIQSHS